MSTKLSDCNDVAVGLQVKDTVLCIFATIVDITFPPTDTIVSSLGPLYKLQYNNGDIKYIRHRFADTFTIDLN